MKVVVTVEELIQKDVWDKFCEIYGLNPYSLNEGLVQVGESFELSLEQAVKIGLIRKEDLEL